MRAPPRDGVGWVGWAERVAPLAHGRGLRVVLEEVEGDEDGGEAGEVCGLELGVEDAQLEDVLVEPDVELRVGACADAHPRSQGRGRQG